MAIQNDMTDEDLKQYILTGQLPTQQPTTATAPTVPPAVPPQKGIGWMDALALGLSGVGDAMLARTGQKGTALPTTLGLIESEAEKKRAFSEQERRNATARSLLARYTGKPESDFANMDEKTIVDMIPLIKTQMEMPIKQEQQDWERMMKEKMFGLKKEEVAAKVAKQPEDKEKPLFTKDMLDQLKKQLPEVKVATDKLAQLNESMRLIDSGQVTGKGGEILSQLAPWAELMGINWGALDKAATFQRLSRLSIADMRLALVGSGQVSNYEQQLLKELSGGGGTAWAAARKLMEEYHRRSLKKIIDYNNTASRAHGMDDRFKINYPLIDTSGFENMMPTDPQKGDYIKQDGKVYEYLGGDKGNEKSWREVK